MVEILKHIIEDDVMKYDVPKRIIKGIIRDGC